LCGKGNKTARKQENVNYWGKSYRKVLLNHQMSPLNLVTSILTQMFLAVMRTNPCCTPGFL
jgi:hypothetical protein